MATAISFTHPQRTTSTREQRFTKMKSLVMNFPIRPEEHQRLVALEQVVEDLKQQREKDLVAKRRKARRELSMLESQIMGRHEKLKMQLKQYQDLVGLTIIKFSYADDRRPPSRQSQIRAWEDRRLMGAIVNPIYRYWANDQIENEFSNAHMAQWFTRDRRAALIWNHDRVPTSYYQSVQEFWKLIIKPQLDSVKNLENLITTFSAPKATGRGVILEGTPAYRLLCESHPPQANPERFTHIRWLQQIWGQPERVVTNGMGYKAHKAIRVSIYSASPEAKALLIQIRRSSQNGRGYRKVSKSYEIWQQQPGGEWTRTFVTAQSARAAVRKFPDDVAYAVEHLLGIQ